MGRVQVVETPESLASGARVSATEIARSLTGLRNVCCSAMVMCLRRAPLRGRCDPRSVAAHSRGAGAVFPLRRGRVYHTHPATGLHRHVVEEHRHRLRGRCGVGDPAPQGEDSTSNRPDGQNPRAGQARSRCRTAACARRRTPAGDWPRLGNTGRFLVSCLVSGCLPSIRRGRLVRPVRWQGNSGRSRRWPDNGRIGPATNYRSSRTTSRRSIARRGAAASGSTWI